MGDNNRLAKNFIGNLIAYIITFSIGFFLTPYIVNNIGTEAYGFVALSINFTTYIYLITVALNSMASRFVAVKIFEKDIDGAKKYFTSVIFANIFISIVLILPTTLLVVYLEHIISIPINLIQDVKILFLITFLTFFLTLITSLFNIAIFVENKLYLQAKRNIEGNIIKVILIVILFSVYSAEVYYISLVALIISLYTIVWNIYYTKKYLPFLKLKKKYFDLKSIKELIASGSWNLLSQISSLLSHGLDLLLANQFINSFAMGVLSISGTIPLMLHSILFSISSIFDPDLTKNFAQKSNDEMMRTLNKSIKLLGVIFSIPLAGIVIFADVFYTLWMPSLDAKELQLLSSLKIMTLIFTGSLASIHEIFTVTNKVKLRAIVTVISSIISIILTILLMKTTNLGLYAVAGVSTAIGILYNYFFIFPYAAKILEMKWYTFHKLSLRSVFCFGLNATIFVGIKNLVTINDWTTFILVCILSGLLGLVANAYIVLNKPERIMLFNKVLRRG